MKKWNGMCPSNRHGLDFEGQRCDICALQRALEGLTREQENAICTCFEVARSTVTSWQSGTARPRPLLVDRIIAFVQEMRS